MFQIIWGGRWQDSATGGSGEDMGQLFPIYQDGHFQQKC